MAQFFQNQPKRFDWVLRLLIAAALGVAALLVTTVWQQLRNQEETAAVVEAAGAVLEQPARYVGVESNLLQLESFDSGSNGSDGPLVLTTTGVITFSPTAFSPTLDVDGDYIYHFTDIYIGPGVTVVMKPPYLNAPVYWLASGTVQIEGVIDLSGEDGKPYSDIPADRQIAAPGAGGYSGGIFRWGSYLAQKGLGPGGGCAYNTTDSTSGSASHVAVGFDGLCNIPGDVYGNVYLAPLVGGSGGGGNGASTITTYRGGGGAGGGALVIASSLSVTVNGSIVANGGDRGGYYAGGGSGGAIHLISPVIGGTGSLAASGGVGSTSNYASNGRIRLEAFEHNFTGSINPTPNRGTPYEVFLPPHPPASVQVVSVSGVAVPDLPMGNFAAPDVTVDVSGPMVFLIEARYVPLGSQVQLYAYSEDGPDLIVNSSELTGTFELSTATIEATLPSGYSRIFVHSDWTP